MTSPSKSSGVPWLVIMGLLALAFLGGSLLTYALFGTRPPAKPLPAPTAVVSAETAGPATQVSQTGVQPSVTPAVIPTLTSTLQPANAPTALPAASATPAATTAPTQPAGPMLEVAQAANIRSGPGFNYPVIGGLEAGKAVALMGRDASAQWFVVNSAAGTKGLGWVSSQVASYHGDVNSLPVIAAPPPPAPTATSVPPTHAAVVPTNPPPASAHGIVGDLQLCDTRTTYAPGERICIVEKIYNASNKSVDYGILGVNAVNTSGGASWFQSSWTGSGQPGGWLSLLPNCTGPVGTCDGPWEDGFKLNAGTYQFTLSICYSSLKNCQGGGDWETLTAPITVVVQ